VSARREGDPPILCASPKRIMQELGWQPEHSSLREIIESAWQWKRKQMGVNTLVSAH
jgi:UDP-glucose 4-epimerase